MRSCNSCKFLPPTPQTGLEQVQKLSSIEKYEKTVTQLFAQVQKTMQGSFHTWFAAKSTSQRPPKHYT